MPKAFTDPPLANLGNVLGALATLLSDEGTSNIVGGADDLVDLHEYGCHALGAGFHLRLVNEPLQADAAAQLRWVLEWIRTGFSIPVVRQIHTIGLRVARARPGLSARPT